MSKAQEANCPYCTEVQLQVYTRKDAHIVCRKCGASLLFTIAEDGSYNVSARPQNKKTN